MPSTRHTLTHASGLLVVALASGCPDGPSGADANLAYVDSPGSGGDGAPIFCDGNPVFGGEPSMELAIGGQNESGAFVPFVDGQEIPFRWGFQGGVMITPSISAPAEIARAGDTCVILDLHNDEPEGASVFAAFPRFVVRLDAVPAGDRLEMYGVFDQIGWAAIPRGTPITLDVTMRGSQGAAHGRIDLVIVPEVAEHCDALPTTGSGCVYRQLPATGRVTSIRARTESDFQPVCPASSSPAQIVEYELTIDEPYRDCTTMPTRTMMTLDLDGYAVPESCLSDNALVVGSTFPVRFDESIAGTCTPYMDAPMAFEAAPCAMACTGE